MSPIGFSTGSLALSDFRRGLSMVQGKTTTAIELSALRDHELVPLIDAIDELDLGQFSYISLHAPSEFVTLTEVEVVAHLRPVAARGWPIVLHPDAIQTFDAWLPFGSGLCIENMDKRKRTGRTALELTKIFERLPRASLCFDIGHARQVDPTMCEAERILRVHGHRIRQLHVSDVTSRSNHESLSHAAVLAFRKVAHLLPRSVPVILETPVPGDLLDAEINTAIAALDLASVKNPERSAVS